MMSMKNVSTMKLIGALIVIVAIAVAIILIGRSHSSSTPVVTDTSSAASATSTGTSASSPVTAQSAPLVYSVATPRKTYSQNEQFDIFVTVTNNTGQTKNFDFASGCEGDYTIGSFDMVAHTRCLPNPTLFTVLPHDQATVKLTHYPAIYKIPAGEYTLHAEIIGYGGSNVPITITK